MADQTNPVARSGEAARVQEAGERRWGAVAGCRDSTRVRRLLRGEDLEMVS
jgi:hypothetical protein